MTNMNFGFSFGMMKGLRIRVDHNKLHAAHARFYHPINRCTASTTDANNLNSSKCFYNW